MLFTSLSLPLSLALPLLFSSVAAWGIGQNSSSSNSSSKYVSALKSAGFTELANALASINGTTAGTQLFSELSSGRNFTLFAPTDRAVSQLSSSISGNASLLAEYISYHFVEGDFTNRSFTNSSGGGSTTSNAVPMSSTTSSSGSATTFTSQSAALRPFLGKFRPFPTERSTVSTLGSSSSNLQPYAGVYPNVTIGRTLLNSSDLVHLAGNKSQVLAWTRSTSLGNVTILNQSQNITVVNGTTWCNLFIVGINGTLIPPGNLTTALTAVNATAVARVLSTAQGTTVNGTNQTIIQNLQNATGITFFIPNNQAFNSSINATLQGLLSNTTAIQALVQNHYINGTGLYSTVIDNSTTAVSAAGEPFSFIKNETGIFVLGANNTIAQIVRPDVLLNNGVAHIIDHVLYVTESDPAAASSAYESATSVAAQSTTETGPIVGPTQTSSTQSASSSESTSSSVSQTSSTESTSSSASIVTTTVAPPSST